MGLEERIKRLEKMRGKESPYERYLRGTRELEEVIARIAEEELEGDAEIPTEEEIEALEMSSDPLDQKHAEISRVVRKVLLEEEEERNYG